MKIRKTTGNHETWVSGGRENAVRKIEKCGERFLEFLENLRERFWRDSGKFLGNVENLGNFFELFKNQRDASFTKSFVHLDRARLEKNSKRALKKAEKSSNSKKKFEDFSFPEFGKFVKFVCIFGKFGKNFCKI